MKKDEIQIWFRVGYSGGVKAEVEIGVGDSSPGVKHLLELDHLEDYIKDVMYSKGYKVEQTKRQKYPRLILNK